MKSARIWEHQIVGLKQNADLVYVKTADETDIAGGIGQIVTWVVL